MRRVAGITLVERCHHKVVHELLLTRSPPGIGVSVIVRLLLALLGPVAVRVKAAAPVVPGVVASVAIL